MLNLFRKGREGEEVVDYSNLTNLILAMRNARNAAQKLVSGVSSQEVIIPIQTVSG